MNSIGQNGDKVARFEAAFNRIHEKLKELVKETHEHAPYSDVLYSARKLHNVVRFNYENLKQFGYLRNAIVHKKIREDFYIAEPHDKVVEEIERISGILLQPPLALSVASQPVKSYSPHTPLIEILAMMDEKGFSQFPIYANSNFQGLLTDGGIAKWLSRNLVGKSAHLDGVTAADLIPLEKKHSVKFLARNSTIYDLESLFEKSFDENKKLKAILITEHGSQNQKPIGIVTTWDLVRIDHSTFSNVNPT
ncbi:MAG TPA: CBS domain-containing protein [Pseudoneobacillus sp.]|nr:CBS domain-containing protein [Pseudoneobacillus sp.]